MSDLIRQIIKRVQPKRFFVFTTLFILLACASMRTAVEFYQPITADLSLAKYNDAVKKIEIARSNGKYVEKDRVLYYLDHGIVSYYAGNHQQSIKDLQAAELAMEELFTKSVSKAAASFILNDNALDYFGEVYENFYVNVFMALNYINTGKFDDAYVEVNRVNDKLRELDTKYGDMAREMNNSDDAHGNIKYESSNFYNDALANFLSYIIFRAEGEYDNSRISYEKMVEAFRTQPDVYNFELPRTLKEQFLPGGIDRFDKQIPVLSVIAFAGQGPYKYGVGGQITTYKDYVAIQDLSFPIAFPNIYFPGAEPGYHFKFAFPAIKVNPSSVAYVEVWADGNKMGELDVLERMDLIAQNTFQSHMTMIAVKTILRTVVKGIAAAEVKKKAKKETNANAFGSFLIDLATDVAVDATENPDLRCWRTMPQTCYAGEFPLMGQAKNIEVRFLNRSRIIVDKKVVPNYRVSDRINLIDAYTLN